MTTQAPPSDGRVRVLHVITDAGPHPYFETIGAYADRERFDVRLACLGPAGWLQEAAARMGLEALALGARGRASYATAALRLARYLRRERIDVVQTHLLDGSVVGLSAARLARTPAVIFTAHHCHEIPLHDRRMLTAVDRLCAGRLCDAIIAPSRQMRDTLVEFHRAEPASVRVIHHGFDLERLNPNTVNGAAARAELGLEGRLVIGTIGRLYWIKNQEALVRAFAGLAPSVPEAVLLIVGGGDSSDLRTLARSLDIDNRVLLTGARDDVPELLAAMDLFVQPALAEAFGMVVVEAMAMARPVVSTPTGITPEVVVDGVSGFMAENAEPWRLQQVLKGALAIQTQWPTLAGAGRHRALAFQPNRMVASYERLYLSLLGGYV